MPILETLIQDEPARREVLLQLVAEQESLGRPILNEAILTALIVPFRSKAVSNPDKERPVELSIEPSSTGGVTLQIKGRLP